MKLTLGNYYTVIDGRFSGITGIAVETATGQDIHALSSPDFPDDGVISFFNMLGSLRDATDEEELALRRRMG